MLQKNKTIKYVNRDFSEFRTALSTFIKTYFPEKYGDFSEASPGQIFLEAASYVGDALSFTADVNLGESLLSNVEERINLYHIAQYHGSKPRTVSAASVDLEVFQLLPAIGSGNQTKPDFRYALYIEPNMVVSTQETNRTYFYTRDAIDFKFSSSYDPTTITTYSVLGDGSVEYFLAKKVVKATSGEIKSKTFSFTDPKIYDKIVLDETNVTEIVSMIDSDENNWYEVPYLAQDLVPQSIRNVPYNDPVLSQYQSSVPYLLCYKQTENRFITRLRKDDTFEIQFGAGLSSEADEEIVPNPFNVGLGLNYFERVTDVSIDPSNFLYTRTYGSAPSNTTLTVRYAVSNGLRDNVNSNTITAIAQSTIVDPIDTTDPVVLQTIKDSLIVNNPYSAFGGSNRKDIDNIRQDAMANFAAQNRAVTKEDYILRCLSLPAKYGSISKAYIQTDYQLNGWNQEYQPNPFAMDLFVAAYDSNMNFVACNQAMKENLRWYLKQYRLLTDALNIKDLLVVDISCQIEIYTLPNQNSNEVLLRCLNELIVYFHPDKIQPQQPIFIGAIRTLMDRVEGVQSIASIHFENIADSTAGYSPNFYDMANATRQEVIYPSVDPMIWNVRNPKVDLKVRVVDF